MIGASFDSTKTPLQDLLTRAHSGALQLPDFQRGWVWDDERIRSLLASVSVSFPIGAVMLLQTGGEHIRFKPRPLAGTDEKLRDITPETLVLDGQQRLTSLYRALMSQTAVETKDAKNKPIRRWYYIDMKLYVLLTRDGGRDFRAGESAEAQLFFEDKINIHHIFPEKWCKQAEIEPATYNGGPTVWDNDEPIERTAS